MKIYVAAKFSYKEQVKDVYKLLKSAGHVIFHEWVYNKPSYPFDQNPEFTKKCTFVVGPHFDLNFCFWHPAVTEKNSIQEVLIAIEQYKANFYTEEKMQQF